MKQPLVATLRTDKNGRTQLRHMRPECTSAGSRPMPPPARPEATEWEDHLLAAAGTSGRGPHEQETARRYLTSLAKADPAFPDHAKALIGTPDAAGRAATQALSAIIAEGVKQYTPGRSEAAWHGWCTFAIPPRGRHLLSLAAAMGSVHEECGEPEPSWEDLLQLAWNVSSDISSGASHDAYWRGIAAYVLADPDWERMRLLYRPERKREAVKFVLWAGQQKRIAAVVSAALDSGCIEPETLDHLMGVLDEIEPAVREGAL